LLSGVIATAGPDRKTRSRRIAGEAFVERQLAALLVDHHQPGLVVDTFARTPAKRAEGRIVHPDQLGGVDRPGTGRHVQQP
jgi:hypothetical protein